MRALHLIAVAALIALAACARDTAPGQYLFVWAGDSAHVANDFLGVIDADPSSPGYGSIVSSLPVSAVGTHPHHTEAEMPANGHLLANGFASGRTWLFDLTTPRQPKILTTFGDLAGLSHPHTYTRLANGTILTTFQYAADSSAAAPMHDMSPGVPAMPMPMPSAPTHTTGGLVVMDERGTVIRSGRASDPAIADRELFPYSAIEVPALDRVVSTTTDMDAANTKATSEWVQLWRASDLTLLRSIALPAGPRGDEHKFTGEPHLLADGTSVYIHTFNCGLYLLRDIETAAPKATFVHGFEGTDCGVPVLTRHYWLQPVPAAHALVAMDISDPAHPREVSRVAVGDDEQPHWIAMDRSDTRVVLNSGGSAGNRLFIINFDPATGALSVDDRFRDPGATRPGVRLTGKTWPHGFAGTAWPHGTVFSR